ncbi:MAG: hypothetical protein JF599_00325 [Verrucomicrobia bacterium]|nr:hypothetical protein [Verrucomicrobiota bacterium]
MAFLSVGLGLPLALPAATLSYQTATPTPGANDVSNFTGAARDSDNISGDGSSDGVGAPVSGNDSDIDFIESGGAPTVKRFYRVSVDQ